MAPRLMILGILALGVGCMLGPSLTAEATQEDEKKPPPPPNPELAKVHYFVGTWDGVMELMPSEHRKAGKTTAVATYEAKCNGFVVACDWIQQPDPDKGGDPYEAHSILAFDTEERGYRLWWLDSRGQMMTGIGRWKGKTIEFKFETVYGGRNRVTVVTYEIVSDTEHKIKMETGWKGEDTVVIFTSTFTKRP